MASDVTKGVTRKWRNDNGKDLILNSKRQSFRVEGVAWRNTHLGLNPVGIVLVNNLLNGSRDQDVTLLI